MNNPVQQGKAESRADEVVDIYETDEEEFSRPEERGEKALDILSDLTTTELQWAVIYLAERLANFT